MYVDGNNENGIDKSVDGGDKHITNFSAGVDCCLKKRSKQNGHVDCHKENGVEDSVIDSANFSYKCLTHLLQGVDYLFKERIVCNTPVDGDESKGVKDSVDNNADLVTSTSHISQQGLIVV
eukprot:5890856-Ditylum_brightwellii.AAC.1